MKYGDDCWVTSPTLVSSGRYTVKTTFRERYDDEAVLVTGVDAVFGSLSLWRGDWAFADAVSAWMKAREIAEELMADPATPAEALENCRKLMEGSDHA